MKDFGQTRRKHFRLLTSKNINSTANRSCKFKAAKCSCKCLKVFLVFSRRHCRFYDYLKGFASKEKYQTHRTKRKCDTDSTMALFWKPNLQTPTKPNMVFTDRSLMLLTKDICLKASVNF